MKHYADEKDNKAPVRQSSNPSGGRHFASEEDKPRYTKQPDRFEKKTAQLRIKREAQKQPAQKQSALKSEDATKLYPVKKSDIQKLEKGGAKRPRTDVPATPTAPVPKMKAGYAPAFIFAGFILVMMGWFVFNTVTYFANGTEKEFSPSEKRILADFPQVLKSDSDKKTTGENAMDALQNVASGDFGKGFETFFSDHFPVRKFWVGTNAYATLYEGYNGANGVYHCAEGYLINEPVPEDNQIDNNLENLTDFKLDIGDTPMTAMFVPSTGYVADDKLPLVHKTYRDDEYFDKISKVLKNGGVDFVDLRDTFKTEHKNGSQLYYKTDHHWTTRGAYTAYKQLCEKLGITPTPESAFSIEKYGDFYGTTYSKSGFWFTPPDTVEVWNNRANTPDKINVTIRDGKTEKNQNSMFFYEHDKEEDKYPIFIDGNHFYTEITNKNAKGGTIVVIKDSFSHCMAPFLAENYSKVIMVDMRYNGNTDVTELVKKEKAEQVLVLYGIDNFAEDTDLGHLWG